MNLVSEVIRNDFASGRIKFVVGVDNLVDKYN